MLSSFFLVVTAVGNQQTFLGTDGAIFKESIGSPGVQQNCMKKLGLAGDLKDVTPVGLKRALQSKMKGSPSDVNELVACMTALSKVKGGGCTFRRSERCLPGETQENQMGNEVLCCPFDCSQFDNDEEKCRKKASLCTWQPVADPSKAIHTNNSGYCKPNDISSSQRQYRQHSSPKQQYPEHSSPNKPHYERRAQEEIPTRDTTRDEEFSHLITDVCKMNIAAGWQCSNKGGNKDERITNCEKVDFLKEKCPGFCWCAKNNKL